MGPIRLSLRVRLLLAFALVLMPVLLLLGYELWADYQRRVDTVLVDQLQTAHAVAAIVDASFDEGLTLGRSLASEDEILAMDPARADAYLQARQPLFPQYSSVSLFDAAGHTAGSSIPFKPGEARPSIADRPYFQKLMATNREQVSDVVVGRFTGRPVVLLAVPVRAPDGSAKGTLVVSLSLDRLSKRVSIEHLAPSQTILLADRTGRLAVNTGKPDLTWEERDYSGVQAMRQALAGQDVEQDDFHSPIFHDQRLAAFAPSPGHDWVAGATQSRDAALMPIWQGVLRDVAGVIGLVLLALGLSFFLSRGLLTPVRRLTRYARSLGRSLGQGLERAAPEPVPEVQTGDELEVLGESLSSMAHEVRRRVAEVQRANARLAALMEVTETLVSQLAVQDVAQVAVERGAAIMQADFAAIWLADVQREELHLLTSRGLSPEASTMLRDIPLQSPLLAAVAARTGEIQVVADYAAAQPKDPVVREAIRLVDLRTLVVAPLHSRQGLAGVVGYGWSHVAAFAAPERHTVEALADMLALALERVQLIDDLRTALRVREEFLNLAAHELKTPLTTLRGYTQLLVRRGAHDEEERRLFRALSVQGNRIGHLAETLVDVSLLQSGELILHLSRLDLCRLAQQVVGAMQAQAPPQHQLGATCDGPAVVEADPVRIREVLVNLVDNAVKYSPHGGPIEVSVRAREGEAVVCVRDHGIGVPQEKQAELFQAFYQVAPMVSPTRGMELGLYISRESVRRHGGRIWFESQEGQGSTFCFSLPRPVDGAGPQVQHPLASNPNGR